jgi:hypothetical protein
MKSQVCISIIVTIERLSDKEVINKILVINITMCYFAPKTGLTHYDSIL